MTIRKVAAVVVRGGLLLVVRKRGSSVFLSPGGKPKRGENAEQALARELAEETGLRLRSCRPFGTFADGSALEKSTTVRIESFLTEVDGLAVPGAEIEEVAWIDSGYREDGLELGSVFERFVVPELLANGVLRQRRTPNGDQTVVVADLDGTLTFDGRPPGPDVSAALHGLTDDENIRLVFATSRAPRGARALLGSLVERADLVCCNGAVQVRGGMLTQRVPLPAVPLRATVDLLCAEGTGFYLEYGDHFLVSGGGFPWMDYPDRSELQADQPPPMDSVVKLVIDAPEPARWVARLRELVGSVVELCAHADGVLDMTMAGVTKATAVAELSGGKASNMIVFGNDLNDQDLLGQADVAVVVGNGLPGLDRAGHVRRVPAEDIAVAAALRRAVTLVAQGGG